MNHNGPSMLAFLGIPAFSLVVGLVIVAAIAAFIFGVSHWRQTRGKVIALTAGVALVLLVTVVICVLITVWSGSMG